MVDRHTIGLLEQLLQVRHGNRVLCRQLGKGHTSLPVRQQMIPEMVCQRRLLGRAIRIRSTFLRNAAQQQHQLQNLQLQKAALCVGGAFIKLTEYMLAARTSGADHIPLAAQKILLERGKVYGKCRSIQTYPVSCGCGVDFETKALVIAKRKV